jgi:hypothetical protein
MRWAEHAALMEKQKYTALVRKPEGEKLRGRLSVDVRIIKKWILKKHDGRRVDWIHLAQGRGQWRALVNTVMNL